MVNKSSHSNIVQPGGVYSCSFRGDNQCQLLNIDSSNNNIGQCYCNSTGRSHLPRIDAYLRKFNQVIDSKNIPTH